MYNVAELLQAMCQHWLLATPGITLVLVLGWLVRNRYHNGLHKYPGPFLASLTNWWRFYDVYKRRSEVTLIDLHKKHGPVVRLGPNVLSFADPKALKAIYGLNNGFIKSDFYHAWDTVVRGHVRASMFSTTDTAFHALFRRSVNSAFAMSTLVQYEPFVDSTTRLFFKQTERLFVDNNGSADSKPCDFARWLQFYAFDVVGEMTYGQRHGFVERNEDVDGIVAFLTRQFMYIAPVGQIPILDLLFFKNPLYLKLSQWGFVDATSPAARFARARLLERLPELVHKTNGGKEIAKEKEKEKAEPQLESKPQPRTDLLTRFLAAREARPDFMTDNLVQAMCVTMAVAGSDTTAISLSAVFYFLLKNPRCLARLVDEIDTAARAGRFAADTKGEGLVGWHESQTLPYLDACVKEAFRLHPAVGLPLERVVPAGGAEIAGCFVPAGTIVGCSAFVVHRDRAVFGDDTDAFRPERWLVGEGKGGGEDVGKEEERRLGAMNAAMLHFGMGSRTCIGKNISLLEVYKLVPSMLRRFTIRLDDPKQEWETINVFFVKQNNFKVRFTPREIVQPD